MLTHHSWKRGNILPAALFVVASGLPVHAMADGQSGRAATAHHAG